MRIGFGKPEENPEFLDMKYRVELPDRLKRAISGRAAAWREMTLWFLERGQGDALVTRDMLYFNDETTALAFDLRWVYQANPDIPKFHSHGGPAPEGDPEEEKEHAKQRRANLEKLIREKRWKPA